MNFVPVSLSGLRVTIHMSTARIQAQQWLPFLRNQFQGCPSQSPRVWMNPVTGKSLEHLRVIDSSRAQVEDAVKAAKDAQPRWASTAGPKRRDILLQWAQAMEADACTLAELESLSGKPIRQARSDVLDAVEVMRHFAGFADKLDGRVSMAQGQDLIAHTLRQPLGICGILVSYNYPLVLACWKLAPALACGNAVLLKPHPTTPFSALRLAELAVKHTDLPCGLLSVLPGDADIGQAIVENLAVDKISFTGSGTVGRNIMKTASSFNLKRVTLELGGKSPLIVFPDVVDLESCADDLLQAMFSNMGQNCCAGSRLYIHESIHDALLPILLRKVKSMRIGDPSDESTDIGPVVSKEQFDKIMGFIQRARDRDLVPVTGGRRWGNQGYFIEPTVFLDVSDGDELACEEVFGPVLSVMKPFKTEEEVIQRANSSDLGLAAGVWTRDLKIAHRASRDLKTGIVWINCYNIIQPGMPFGGLKGSGFGYDLGPEAVFQEYTTSKSIYTNIQ